MTDNNVHIKNSPLLPTPDESQIVNIEESEFRNSSIKNILKFWKRFSNNSSARQESYSLLSNSADSEVVLPKKAFKLCIRKYFKNKNQDGIGMAAGVMADARPDTPKRYSCACGLSQDDRKRQFAGKCRHCHTRPKYLRAQSSFDSGSAGRRNANISSLVSSGASCSTSGSVPHSSSSQLNVGSLPSSVSVTEQHPRDCRACDTSDSERSPSISYDRRRSRSVDRYDVWQLTGGDPPPYSRVVSEEEEETNTRSRRAVRDRNCEENPRRANSTEETDSLRAARLVTPPPPYEVAQRQMPPTYEEALATSMGGLCFQPELSAILSSPANNHCRTMTTPSPAGLMNVHQPTPIESSTAMSRQRRSQQRHRDREAEREAQLDQDRELENQRIRDLQLAQYCGCAKCQGLYYDFYDYYYDESMNDGGTFAMETPVLMQEVLTDGLAFCSMM